MRIRPPHQIAIKTMKALMFAAGIYLLAACNVAANYEVNTTLDTVDANPGDGNCADANGNCSLRAATQEANADTTNPSTITLVGGETYTLSNGPIEDNSVAGDLDLRAPTTIHTNRTGQATIDALSSGGGAIHIDHGVGTTTLTNLNIINTSTFAAVLIDGTTETVTVTSTRLHNNSRGAIAHNSPGTLGVSDSTIDNNVSTSSGANYTVLTTGDMTLYRTTITDNTATAQVSNNFGANSITVDSSTITGTTNAIEAFSNVATTITASVIDTDEANCTYRGPIMPTVSGGNNLQSDFTCGLSGPGDNTTTGGLKPLADNGGPVPTQMPNFFSGAHDGFVCPTGVGTDARGLPRGGATNLCDKGATEAQAGEATGADCLPIPNLGPAAELQACNLSGVNMRQLNLAGANLFSANLVDADLTGAILTNANLFNANAVGAEFFGTDLTGVNVTNADLSLADMTVAITSGTNFTNATWFSTTCPDQTNSDNNNGTCENNL